MVFGAILLIAGLATSTDLRAGVLAYFNFIVGVTGGIAIGRTWLLAKSHWGWIDVGLACFLAVGSAQLMVNFAAADATSEFHQNALTPWGNSNYVAGALVVGGLTLLTRAFSVRARGRSVVIVLVAVAWLSAILTLSRGGIVALGVGMIFLLWFIGRGALGKWGYRLGAATAVVLAVALLDFATSLRGSLNNQVHRNVDIRIAFWDEAWSEFLSSPLMGTGWATFRSVTADAFGMNQTFAHNLFLSFLQIGGILAVPFLAAVLALFLSALRRSAWLVAPVAAAFAISMTDPFFEGTVGNLLAIPPAVVAAYRPLCQRMEEL